MCVFSMSGASVLSKSFDAQQYLQLILLACMDSYVIIIMIFITAALHIQNTNNADKKFVEKDLSAN